MKRKAQVWSMDLIIAVVIFLLAIGVFYFFTESKATNNSSKLRVESQIVANRLTGDEQVSIVEDGSINETRLGELVGTEYLRLKEELGVGDDFCIILRDQDGNLIIVGNGTHDVAGIGNSELNITIGSDSYNCSEAIP